MIVLLAVNLWAFIDPKNNNQSIKKSHFGRAFSPPGYHDTLPYHVWEFQHHLPDVIEWITSRSLQLTSPGSKQSPLKNAFMSPTLLIHDTGLLAQEKMLGILIKYVIQ